MAEVNAEDRSEKSVAKGHDATVNVFNPGELTFEEGAYRFCDRLILSKSDLWQILLEGWDDISEYSVAPC